VRVVRPPLWWRTTADLKNLANSFRKRRNSAWRSDGELISHLSVVSPLAYVVYVPKAARPGKNWPGADFYLCGPPAFLEDFTAGLNRWGVARDRVHTEIFGSGKSITPGVKAVPRRLLHAPTDSHGEGPRISFARAGLTVCWDPKFQSLLELAEACGGEKVSGPFILDS
jgi:ferredoxin-NADP reductase